MKFETIKKDKINVSRNIFDRVNQSKHLMQTMDATPGSMTVVSKTQKKVTSPTLPFDFTSATIYQNIKKKNSKTSCSISISNKKKTHNENLFSPNQTLSPASAVRTIDD